MKKRILLSIATASVLAIGVQAGTLTITSKSGENNYVVAEEIFLASGDHNISAIDMNTTLMYKTGNLPSGTVSEPAITLEFPPGVKAWMTSDSNVTIQGGITIAKFTSETGNGTNQLIFDKVTGSSVNSNTDLNITGSLTVQFPSGVKSTTANLRIGYSTSPDTADQSGDVSFIVSKKQLSATITKKFDAFIDATNDFKTFVDASGSVQANDTLTFEIKEDPSKLDYKVSPVGYTTVVKPDTNVSIAGTMSAQVGSSNITVTQGSDGNYTSGSTPAAPSTTAKKITYTFAPTGTTGTERIPEASFLGTVIANVGTTDHETLMENADGGSWVIYGYKGQIPNVASTSNVDVTMKFTNRSTVDTNIYFTLIDPDGTVVSLSSADHSEIASLPAGTTGIYKASDLLELVSDPAFNKAGSFSVEVNIPTTPKKVYGFASFKNKKLGQFKDLPIYNTSSMSY